MNSPESLVGTLAALRSRQLSVAELVDAYIRQIERTNDILNAVVVPTFDQAMQAARALDRRFEQRGIAQPLYGIPVTIKECYDMVGTPSTAGIDTLRTRRVMSDSTMVRTLRRAGAIVVGKTNLAQMIWFNETDNPVYGRTNNPWDPNLSPGGSSGGEGANVAAGGSLLGVGTDSGGSVRLPAHFCGINAIKPTAGRLSTQGTVDSMLLGDQDRVVNQPGLLARSVDDLGYALGALLALKNKSGDWSSPPIALARNEPIDLRSLRVGVLTELGELPTSLSTRDVIERAAAGLAGEGATVLPFTAPHLEEATAIYTRLFSADGGVRLRELLNGSRLDWRIERLLRLMEAEGRLTPYEYHELNERRIRYAHRFADAMENHRLDVLISPVYPTPAFRHGESAGSETAKMYTVIYNLVGLPAGVVAGGVAPASEFDARGQSRGDFRVCMLPVGVQVAGRHWHEATVLGVMGMLEKLLEAGLGSPKRV